MRYELQNNLLTPWWDEFFGLDRPRHRGEENQTRLMKTDIKELANGYELTMNLPAIKKDDIKLSIEDGYLTVEASVTKEDTKEHKDTHYICRERFSGSYRRSFYIGDEVKEDKIKAKLADGVLTLNIPKEQPKQLPKKFIKID